MRSERSKVRVAVWQSFDADFYIVFRKGAYNELDLNVDYLGGAFALIFIALVLRLVFPGRTIAPVFLATHISPTNYWTGRIT